MDLDSQQQPESELISLTTQTISLFNSMDLDSHPMPLRKLIQFISQRCSLVNSTDSDSDSDSDQAIPLVDQSLKLEPEPELMSLIHQILLLVVSMNSKSRKLIYVCPQVVRLENGKFHEIEEVSWSSNNKWHCFPSSWYIFRLTGEDATYFLCRGCNGVNHKEYDKAPVLIKHTLHPKHSLHLVWSQHSGIKRECYCCDEDLQELFYYCSACDMAINLACVDKPSVLSINHPKWHEHTLTLFPRHTSKYLRSLWLGRFKLSFLYMFPLCLVGGYDGVMNDENNCSACPWLCTSGFFYKCGSELCRFKLHVQCATTSELFVHESHIHPLFLTSKPGEERICSVCKQSRNCSTSEIFNCIENCDFALCFKCATLPQKMRYSDDEHMLTLSYGEETSTRTHWCEECEMKIGQDVPFYMCGYCCVALHIECILGADLYMMPGSSWLYYGSKVDVLLNNCHSSRPICSFCKWRCPYKIYIQCSGFIFCSTVCMREFHL